MLEYKDITYMNDEKMEAGIKQMEKDGWKAIYCNKVFHGSLFGPVSKIKQVTFKHGKAETEAEIKMEKRREWIIDLDKKHRIP